MSYRRSVYLKSLPSLVILSHDAQEARQPEAVISMGVRDKYLGDLARLHRAPLNLVMSPTQVGIGIVPSTIHPQGRGEHEAVDDP